MIQIHYDLSAGIKPAPPLKRRYAGVMGEVDGVEVTFTVPDAYADDAYRKRVEFVDVTGKLFTTDEVAYNELLMQSGTTLRLTLPWQWTVYGSTGFIRMVFYKTDDADAVTPLEFTPQFPLYFDTTEEANDKVERRSLAQLIVDGHGAVKNAATASSNANQAANAAAAAAEQARSVAINIETAKENGQFDGADGADGVSVQHVNIDPGTQHLIITLSNGKVIDAGELPKGEQGVSVASVAINENGHLIVTLSDGEKLDAGEIPGGGGGGAVTDAVLYTEQELTEAQQAQARTNSGAQPQTLIVRFDTSNLGYATHTSDEIKVHREAGGDVIYIDEEGNECLFLDNTGGVRFYRDTVTNGTVARDIKKISNTGVVSGTLMTTSVPTALPNPNALTFTGAVEGAYDGSKPLTVNIPEGGEGGTKEVYVQTEEPTDAPDGSIWVNPDGESPESGSGGDLKLSLVSSQNVTDDVLTFLFDNLNQYDEFVILLVTKYGVVTSATATINLTELQPEEYTSNKLFQFYKIGTVNQSGNGSMHFTKKGDDLLKWRCQEGVATFPGNAPTGAATAGENLMHARVNSITITFEATPTNGVVQLYAR